MCVLMLRACVDRSNSIGGIEDYAAAARMLLAKYTHTHTHTYSIVINVHIVTIIVCAYCYMSDGALLYRFENDATVDAAFVKQLHSIIVTSHTVQHIVHVHSTHVGACLCVYRMM